MAEKMIDVGVGQKVMVSPGYGRKDVVSGEVVKVARVWIHVHREGQGWGWRFRRDTQTDGSDFGSPPRFYTLDQWAELQRDLSASRFLREQGVSVEVNSPWWRRPAELATLLGWVAPEDVLLQ